MKIEEKIANAGKGSITPIVREIGLGSGSPDALSFFAELSDYGRKENSMLLESADIITRYGEKSIGSSEPCVKVTGRKAEFEIRALNSLGEKFIDSIADDFSFCDEVSAGKKSISGRLSQKKGSFSEEERLKLKTHADILRAIAFKLKPPKDKPLAPFAGLFGNISYDFIDQFEELPENERDELKEPDYELCFHDSLFTLDHKQKKLLLIANALVFGEEFKEIADECEKKLDGLEKKFHSAETIEAKQEWKAEKAKPRVSTDTSEKEFVEMVKKAKENIFAGDVFQLVLSRTITSNYSAEPLEIYAELRRFNPSPYMFYLNQSTGVLLGSSPETFIRIEGNGAKTVEIRPIAGTKPRGYVNGKLDADLDSRFETELKLDEKELAEHTMLVDLARNDVARVCKAGTRHVDKPYIVEKYSHVQHIVSNVKGELKEGFDALHAYLASMNMGTLTGAPKVEAMKLIRQYEKTKRGFYGGSVGYLTPAGDFDSCIAIRCMRLKNGKAVTRAGAGIVFDSVPEKEFIESEKKARACIKAIELAESARR
ncbi:MAG: anthranilate synthase component 1 [Candidatus Diapherotrites archaeon]